MKTIALLITAAMVSFGNTLPPTWENTLPPTWELTSSTITSIDA